MEISNFRKLWETEVKDLALACVNEEVVSLLNKDKEKYTKTEIKKLDKFKEQYMDIWTIYHISNMIGGIDYNLADEKEFSAIIHVMNIEPVISKQNEFYWEENFNLDFSSDEAKNILALAEGLNKMLKPE